MAKPKPVTERSERTEQMKYNLTPTEKRQVKVAAAMLDMSPAELARSLTLEKARETLEAQGVTWEE